jgi:hypothetical protein
MITFAMLAATALLASLAITFFFRVDVGAALCVLVVLSTVAIACVLRDGKADPLVESADFQRMMTTYQACTRQVTREACVSQAIQGLKTAPEAITLVAMMQHTRFPLSGQELVQLRTRVEGFEQQGGVTHQPLSIDDQPPHAQQPKLPTTRG